LQGQANVNHNDGDDKFGVANVLSDESSLINNHIITLVRLTGYNLVTFWNKSLLPLTFFSIFLSVMQRNTS